MENQLKSIKTDQGLEYINLLKIITSNLQWLLELQFLMFVFHTKSSKPVMKSYKIAPNKKSIKEIQNLLEGGAKT